MTSKWPPCPCSSFRCGAVSPEKDDDDDDDDNDDDDEMFLSCRWLNEASVALASLHLGFVGPRGIHSMETASGGC